MGKNATKASKTTRRITKKTSPEKALAKEKKQKKEKKGGKGTTRKSSYAKNPYQYFVMSQRKEVMSRAGLEETPMNFEKIAKALSAAWHALSKPNREPFEACAALDRSRRDIDQMKGARLRSSPDELGYLVKTAVEALAHTPLDSCSAAGKASEDVVKSLEALDNRIDNAGRAAAAAGLRNGPKCAEVLLAAGAVGSVLGGRLTALIRKWSAAPAAKRSRAPKEAPKSPAEKPPPAAQASPTGEGGKEGDVDKLRSLVVGMLMRTAGQKLGQASFDLCQRIEGSLFRQFGDNAREYRQRARSLNVNIGRPDSRLLQKVVDGSLSPAQLAGLSGEELAPEALRIQREMERQKYFREEVHLTAAPKNKRELMGGQPDGSERPKLRRKSSAPPEEGDANNPAPMEDKSSSSTSSSSSSSSDSDSESSVWEEIPSEGDVPMPIADAAADCPEMEGGQVPTTEADSAERGQTASAPALAPRSPPRESPQQLAAPSSAPARKEKPDALNFFLSMGYDANEAMNAFYRCRGDLDATIAMLDSEQAEATSSAAPPRTATSGASASSAPPAASHQSDNGTDGSALSTLLQMGYEKRQAMIALQDAGGKLELAAELLAASDIMETREEAPAASSAQANNPPPQSRPPPSPSLARNATPMPGSRSEALQTMVSMGFEEHQALTALEHAGGNVQEAIFGLLDGDE